MAGLLFVFYILSMTIATPKTGITNAVFLVLLGQIISATLLDHYDLLVDPGTKLTASRLLGISLMIVGLVTSK